MGEEGLEPSRSLRPFDFKSNAYTNSAIRPHIVRFALQFRVVLGLLHAHDNGYIMRYKRLLFQARLVLQ